MKTGRGPRSATSSTSIRQAERRAEMMALRVQGLTLAQIGERMGVGTPTVSRVISNALAEHTREPAEELLALELGRCDVLLSEAMQTVKAFHPLVSAGRVVSSPILDNNGHPVRNSETGDMLTRVLEDKAPKLAAIATAIRVMERRAKLLGLDAATKLQQEVNVTAGAPEQGLNKLNDNDLNLYSYLIETIADAVDTSPRNIRQELQEKLSLDEIETLQFIFKKLDVRYIAAETLYGLYNTQPRLTHQ